MNFTKICPVGLTLFHADGRSGGHDDVNEYSLWKRNSNLHILLTVYSYTF